MIPLQALISAVYVFGILYDFRYSSRMERKKIEQKIRADCKPRCRCRASQQICAMPCLNQTKVVRNSKVLVAAAAALAR